MCRCTFKITLIMDSRPTEGPIKSQLSVRPSFCLSVRLPVCLSVCLSACLSVCLSFCLSVFLSFCLSVYLSFCLSVFLSSCPSVVGQFSIFLTNVSLLLFLLLLLLLLLLSLLNRRIKTQFLFNISNELFCFSNKLSEITASIIKLHLHL